MAIDKPSSPEEEYFAKQEAETKKKLRKQLKGDRDKFKKEHKKDLHWMKCPKCGHDLEEEEYENIMVDVCKECGGIWLDPGEMELLAGGGFAKGLLKRFKRK